MKMLVLLIPIFLFLHCSNHVAKQSLFDFKKAEGVWVPYEIIYDDGTINNGSFTAFGIFGSYSESFKLNQDQTFTPIIWYDKKTFTLSLIESGLCSYSENSRKLTFSGVWELEFDLIKFNKDEMWLKRAGALYKFKKQNP